MDDKQYAELSELARERQKKGGQPSFYFTGEDHLRLSSWGAFTGAIVSLEGRFLTLEGEIVPFQFRHVPTNTRALATTLHRLGEGFLLNVQLRTSVGAVPVGQLYAVLQVVRGSGSTVIELATLLAGYVTATSPLGWPGSAHRESIDGRGVLRTITGTNPAAGANILESVPLNARWHLIAFAASLVTDATVANREARVTFDDGTSSFASIAAGYSQTASLTRRYTFAPHATRYTATVAAEYAIPIPWLDMGAGYRIQTLTVNLQAGDDWGAPTLLVEEWIED